MPYTIRKVPRRRCYRVTAKKSRHVFAKCTSLEKAKRQVRLLRAIDLNPKFITRRRII